MPSVLELRFLWARGLTSRQNKILSDGTHCCRRIWYKALRTLIGWWEKTSEEVTLVLRTESWESWEGTSYGNCERMRIPGKKPRTWGETERWSERLGSRGGVGGGVGVAPEEVGELAMRVLQWETTAHLTRTAQITKTNNTKSCKAVEQLARSSFPGGDSQPLWNTVWQLLSKLNIHSPYNSAILLPRETKPRVHRKSYMIVFIANFS